MVAQVYKVLFDGSDLEEYVYDSSLLPLESDPNDEVGGTDVRIRSGNASCGQTLIAAQQAEQERQRGSSVVSPLAGLGARKKVRWCARSGRSPQLPHILAAQSQLQRKVSVATLSEQV